jgi:hypothetical protein
MRTADHDSSRRRPPNARWLIGLATSVVSAALIVSCGSAFGTATSNPPDASDTEAATEHVDATNIVLGPTVGSDSGETSCDTSREPSLETCLVSDAYGVFVSAATGLDSATGNKLNPLKTITEGIARAAQLNASRVFVCNGNYLERVSLDAQHDGIGLYGGFDCTSGWAWVGNTTQAQVQGPTALYALRIDATTKPVAIEDIVFTVPDATGQDSTGAGNSSIAAFVSNESAGVTFRRVGFHSGAGTDGLGGAAPATNLFSTIATALLGNPANADIGGASKSCVCKVFGTSRGGAGGGAGDPADDGGTGTSAPPATGLLARNGLGGAGYSDQSGICVPGRGGADGASQVDGGAGAPALGGVTGSGWAPASGANGLPGAPGQGGGGGGGGQLVGSGGGGCGGCGGAGGMAGQGGGASAALLLLSASIQVQTSHFTTGSAGAGGVGSGGESGAGGGAGGTAGACGGGAGGSGAGGQGGGGGAGGVSVGILSNASSQTMVDATTTFTLGGAGSGGGPGSGGAGGTVATTHAPQGAPGTKGVDGVAQTSLSR